MNLEELKNTVTNLNEERKRIVQAEGQKAISEAFKEVFAAHPKLESVSWTQYTPYFNDGSPCEFCVHELSEAIYDGAEQEEPAYGEGRDYNKLPVELVRSLKGLQGALQKLDDCMEVIFGDHVEVKATRAGFDVHEYSHD